MPSLNVYVCVWESERILVTLYMKMCLFLFAITSEYAKLSLKKKLTRLFLLVLPKHKNPVTSLRWPQPYWLHHNPDRTYLVLKNAELTSMP